MATTTLRTLDQIKALTPADVLSVYSGQEGACCCGCKGTHYVNPLNKAAAAKSRGYAVDDDECSDRMVRKGLRMLRLHAEQGVVNGDVLNRNEAGERVVDLGDCLSTTVGARLYVVYLKAAK